MLDQPMATVRAKIVTETRGFVIFTAGKRRCWALDREVRIRRHNAFGYADISMTAVLARELGLATEKRPADRLQASGRSRENPREEVKTLSGTGA